MAGICAKNSFQFMPDLGAELLQATLERVTDAGCRRIALLGLTPDALWLRGALENLGLGAHVIGIFDSRVAATGADELVARWDSLPGLRPDLLVVCVDGDKESLLLSTRDLLAKLETLPHVLLAGAAHMDFHDEVFDELNAPALVPSYATGYPNTRVHMYQYLKAASVSALQGTIVEFGAFKGGTTVWLARVAQRLGLTETKVIGFDTWSGFPTRRSLLDLYEHPRCVFTDFDAPSRHIPIRTASSWCGETLQTQLLD